MALQNKFTVEQFSKTIILVLDQTGVYDATANPTGFRTNSSDINPGIVDIADIGNTKGIVFVLETTTGTYSYDSTTDIKARNFPNVNGVKYVLESSYFGLEKYPDGPVTITIRFSGEYTYNDGTSDVTEGFVSEYTQRLFCYKVSECCVENLALAITQTAGVKFCDEPSVKSFRRAKVVFDRMIITADAGKYDLAAQILTEMESVCAGEGACNGC